MQRSDQTLDIAVLVKDERQDLVLLDLYRDGIRMLIKSRRHRQMKDDQIKRLLRLFPGIERMINIFQLVYIPQML